MKSDQPERRSDDDIPPREALRILNVKTEPRTIEIDEVLPPGAAQKSRTGDEDALAGLARLMDDAFVIPGTNIRFGLDPLIGLIPGFGDMIGALISSALLLHGARIGVPKIVLMRMAVNVFINAAIGAIPVAGDVFSVAFKSNVRNLALLQRHRGLGRKSNATDWLIVVGLIAGLLLTVVGSVVVGVLIAETIVRQMR